MHYPQYTKKVFFSLVTLSLCSTAFAGGLLSYEIGTPDLGLASAGYAARAQDAATAVTNPAGMTRLDKTEFLLGVQPLYGHVAFEKNASTTPNGNNGGNAVGWFPGGGAYLVYSATDDLKLGLSSYGNFGSALTYSDDWAGRYYVQRATLLGLTLAPSLAYRLHEKVSVGASFNAMYGILSERAAVNNSPLGLFNQADGRIKVKDNDWGYGWSLGILFEPTDATRLGLTYTSKIDLDFESTLETTNVLTAILPNSFSTPVDLSMTVPQTAMFSFYHAFNNCLALLGNVGWQNWEQFSKVDITIGAANPVSATIDSQYKDSWHGALGLQYWVSPDWQLSIGGAYDSDITTAENRTVSVPVGEVLRLGLGARHFVSPNFNVGAGYTMAWSGDLSINQRRGPLTGRIAGEYEDAFVNYVGVYLNWKFC